MRFSFSNLQRIYWVVLFNYSDCKYKNVVSAINYHVIKRELIIPLLVIVYLLGCLDFSKMLCSLQENQVLMIILMIFLDTSKYRLRYIVQHFIVNKATQQADLLKKGRKMPLNHLYYLTLLSYNTLYFLLTRSLALDYRTTNTIWKNCND